MIFKHPTGEYQPTDHTATITNFGLTRSDSRPPDFLLQLATSDGSNHFAYDVGWAQSMPRIDDQQWAYGQHNTGTGWSGDSMGSYLSQEDSHYSQNMRQYDWQQSATPFDFVGPSPSSAGAIHLSGDQYSSGTQYSHPRPDGRYTFVPQPTNFSDSYTPASNFENQSAGRRFEEVSAVTSSTVVKQESKSPGKPSEDFVFESRA